jgi:hypothetical protein
LAFILTIFWMDYRNISTAFLQVITNAFLLSWKPLQRVVDSSGL